MIVLVLAISVLSLAFAGYLAQHVLAKDTGTKNRHIRHTKRSFGISRFHLSAATCPRAPESNSNSCLFSHRVA